MLRSYIRQRDNLISSAAVHIQRMQKALTQMNIQLHKVISDITGFTGMKIIKAILEGERNALSLAKLKHAGIKSSIDKIAKALEGDYRKEHIFSLKQEVELYEVYKRKIAACDKEIEKHLKTFESKKKEEEVSKYKKNSRYKRGYEPQFDLTSHLIRITGVDVTEINGIEASLGQKIISEIGLDMSKWKTEKHFSSWLGLSPNHKISGKKVKSSKSLKVVNRAATAFRLAARSAGVSKSAIGAFYRRIKIRSGPSIAITATAHKIAKIFYRMLKYGEEFVAIDMEYYEKQYKERLIYNLRKRAKKLGFNLIPDGFDMKSTDINKNEQN